MAGLVIPKCHGSIPYDGPLQEGMVLLGYVQIESHTGVVCSCFHDGKWDNLWNSSSTGAIFSNIQLSNGLLSFDIGSSTQDVYVSVFQTDGLPTT